MFTKSILPLSNHQFAKGGEIILSTSASDKGRTIQISTSLIIFGMDSFTFNGHICLQHFSGEAFGMNSAV